jgi:hypothetical protein
VFAERDFVEVLVDLRLAVNSGQGGNSWFDFPVPPFDAKLIKISNLPAFPLMKFPLFIHSNIRIQHCKYLINFCFSRKSQKVY